MYVCGLIVYNYIYIGNVCSIIVFDMIWCYFEYWGYKVDFVLNFMDVDDKIICIVNELGIIVLEVVDCFIWVFEEDMKVLNVEFVIFYLRVMDYMLDILVFI